ncbi:dipeptide transport system permease protein DppC [Sporolactobacillus inulinus]|uniref:Dipeptide transport system permease protein DppC n=1 Tax=Sporolactobacillus inulinus TaxID=2078 RepID=A0A4Y1ZEJ5_9BACL|nr:oligopeptide ABC transporter permease [Sporolactobacillus inulinus]GAY77419.1 dipeptide transport system permease protein DppC [Sporolactobacillus inulinus]
MGMKLNPNKNVPEMTGTETSGQMVVQFEKEETYLHMVMRRFLKHRLACVGVAVFLLILLIALLAPVIAPQDPAKIFNEFEAPPSAAHWLGTDPVGRDVMSRLIFGAQVSIAVGIGAVAIYVAIGIVLGLVAGYFGGWVDMLIMRLTDVFMSFPYFMVILVLVSIIGPSLFNITLVIGLLGWPAIARLVRGSVLSIKEMDYVKAGVALGYSTPKILFRHILPNALAPILVNATFGVASAIIMEASLSFLGMGVRPPAASWGNMLTQAESITVLSSQPWLWIPPGLMILLAVLSVNFIGDGLRDAIESQNAK